MRVGDLLDDRRRAALFLCLFDDRLDEIADRTVGEGGDPDAAASLDSLDAAVALLPSPLDREPVRAVDGEEERPPSRTARRTRAAS